MFASWGRWLTQHRRLVALASVLSLALAILAMATVTPNLSSEGFVSDGAESAQVDEILAGEFGRGGDSLVFLFDSGQPVDDSAVEQAVRTALAPLAEDERFSAVITTWSTGNPDMISSDGEATYAVALTAPGVEPGDLDVHAITEEVTSRAEENGLTVTTGGGAAIGSAIPEEVESGIIRAETISIPLTLIILVAVFGSFVAAGIPLLVAALAIVLSIAVIFTLSTGVFQSIFAVNIITMLGLGLGIDYSLFMVTRFREEIAHRATGDALAVTMATVGKAILFSGITVIVGLAATQFFAVPALQSMGQAGMVVTALALVYGLTLLPAIMAMLGPRINALSIGRTKVTSAGPESRVWHGIAEAVMRYPVRVLVAVLIVLLAAGLPLLRLDLTPGGPEVLPSDQPARIASERLAAEFPNEDAEPIPVLVTLSGNDATSAESVAELRTLTQDIAAVPGVTQVDSFVSPDLIEGADFTWEGYTGDPSSAPTPVTTVMQSSVRGNQLVVDVSSDGSSSELEQVVRDIREIQPAGTSVEVGGFAAASVDTLNGINDGLVPAAIFVLVGSYLILLLTFGSVFLPLKAIFMTLLSISASLGAVVFVFQDGNFQSLFGFEATGEIISTTPILMFCILFGLSMDYEVLMLSRIQEEYQRTGDNRASVAFGLSHTAKVITGAAAIMVVVFGGFVFADIVILKSMGFGLALAVLIDATIVRGLLVPATMRLMGRWNWWAPAPVRSVVNRLGLSHSSMPMSASDA